MIKNIPYTTLALIHLYVCGCLYLFGFWSTYNINIGNFLSILDVPKNFLIPFVFALGYTLLMNFANTITTDKNHEIIFFSEPIKSKYRFIQVILSWDMLFYTLISVIIFFFIDHKFSLLFWITSQFAICFMIQFKVLNLEIAKKHFPDFRIRSLAVVFITILPIQSFFVGKQNALKIYNNQEFQLIKISSNEISNQIYLKDSIKLIDFVGEKAVISSMNNKNLFIIDHQNIIIQLHPNR